MAALLLAVVALQREVYPDPAYARLAGEQPTQRGLCRSDAHAYFRAVRGMAFRRSACKRKFCSIIAHCACKVHVSSMYRHHFLLDPVGISRNYPYAVPGGDPYNLLVISMSRCILGHRFSYWGVRRE